MNLQTQIRPDLWEAISKTYSAQNYSHAIVDAMHHVTNLLREKSGLDGDGIPLISQVFGGDTPRLRVNKLQTQTERDIQKGIEHIFRGLYSAIRNPRTHEQITDKQEDADSIILFLNYLIGIITRSEEPFTTEKFLEGVFDPYFVKSSKYGSLMAQEIPKNKRLDTLIEIYRQKERGDIFKLEFVVKPISLLKKLRVDM